MPKKMEKKAMASFGTIVAIIGAVLIGLGVLWLVAQNWYGIPDFLKVIILLGATITSYVVGILLRTHEHQGIGKSLLLLGAILYTASIFLIAQIYATPTGLQGIAWLFLLAWFGVLLTSYIFDSSISLVVALAEFLIWVTIQYTALTIETLNEGASIGILTFVYLAIGLLLYGANLLHSSRGHQFANVYRWWTAFYFLAFTYILTFQTILPLLWSFGSSISGSVLAFVLVVSLIAIIVLATGIIISLGKNTLKGKEVLSVLAISVLLIVLIFSAFAVSSTLGICSTKQCYELGSQNECEGANLPGGECKWEDTQYDPQCSVKQCTDFVYNIDEGESISLTDWETLDKTICESADLPNQVCQWTDGGCNTMSCEEFNSEFACSNTPAKLNCVWQNNYCRRNYEYNLKEYCTKYNNDRKSCISESNCRWDSGGFYSFMGSRGEVPFSLWAIWIFANVIFIFVILAVIGYGLWQKSTKLVNLGISAFVLDILTRYIGFIMNFWGATGLALIFIAGGIILIGGGWFIEKWRRKLIAKAKEEVQTE
ncbi:MAG: DUF2157 domain-containing protein [archaeon]|nr:DUF2157 domain-containing protein [archaeon]